MATTNTPLYIPPHRRKVALMASSNSTLPIDEDFVARADFFGKYLYQSSRALRDLVRAKKLYKEDPQIDARFAERKLNDGKALPEMYLGIYKKAMREIDFHTDFSLISRDRIKRFLDLGCAPGGFSRWILENNPSCTGLGFTLPPALGGFRVEFTSPGRYEYFYRDITDKPELICYQDNVDGTTGPQFDLCIAGCTYRSTETSTSNWDSVALWSHSRQRLLYCQLLAALTNLQVGGTLIMVCNLGPHISKIEIICLLSYCFEHLLPIKPKTVRGIRSSYYLVGRNYKPEETHKTNLLERLRTAMKTVTTIDTACDLRNPSLLEGSNDQILAKWGPFALRHYEAMWDWQARAIEEDLDSIKNNNKNRRGWV